MPLDVTKKKEVIGQHRRHETDTGSPEVQIALLSKRISGLSGHFDSHKKDHSSRRGLLTMVSKRRKLLKFLKATDVSKYVKLIGELGLRK